MDLVKNDPLDFSHDLGTSIQHRPQNLSVGWLVRLFLTEQEEEEEAGSVNIPQSSLPDMSLKD